MTNEEIRNCIIWSLIGIIGPFLVGLALIYLASLVQPA